MGPSSVWCRRRVRPRSPPTLFPSGSRPTPVWTGVNMTYPGPDGPRTPVEVRVPCDLSPDVPTFFFPSRPCVRSVSVAKLSTVSPSRCIPCRGPLESSWSGVLLPDVGHPSRIPLYGWGDTIPVLPVTGRSSTLLRSPRVDDWVGRPGRKALLCEKGCQRLLGDELPSCVRGSRVTARADPCPPTSQPGLRGSGHRQVVHVCQRGDR